MIHKMCIHLFIYLFIYLFMYLFEGIWKEEWTIKQFHISQEECKKEPGLWATFNHSPYTGEPSSVSVFVQPKFQKCWDVF